MSPLIELTYRLSAFTFVKSNVPPEIVPADRLPVTIRDPWIDVVSV